MSNNKTDKSQIINFINRWKDKGDEKSDTQKFWLELLRDVLLIERPEELIEFERRVELEHVSFIDAYINKTKIIIEQKSLDIDLSKAAKQSDGSLLTPFDQAKRYYDWLKASERGRWIITCNFKEFWVYDMEMPRAKPEIIKLENLEKEFNKLNILIDNNAASPRDIRELEISIQAGKLVRKFYDAVLPRYRDPESPEALRSLNIFCVRIVFLLYAEDAGLFPKNTFYNYVKNSGINTRGALIELFDALNKRPEERGFYDKQFDIFAYIDGGLFEESGIEIPNLNFPDDEPVKIILDDMSGGFDWSDINPTIFGAIFESTLNPETRKTGGMHYTSLENIHRLIDPLFFDDLKRELDEILALPSGSVKEKKDRNKALSKFQNKIAGLNFLDPACGSGNFLTETFLSLRRLENKILKEFDRTGQIKMILSDAEDPVKVSIKQFYGIEINDFAVDVARTALWISEHQMMRETADIAQYLNRDTLPLKTYNNIIEGNALKLDWGKVIAKSKLNYIIGNPPFAGARLMTSGQKSELMEVFNGWDNAGNLDYVSCWYKKAAEMIGRTKIKAAFVSTNSVTQGDAVAVLWKPLFNDMGVHIDFAWRSFKWSSETLRKMAQVHVVIVGFSRCKSDRPKVIYTLKDKDENLFDAAEAEHINAYLLDAPDVFVAARQTPLCDVPEIGIGNKPIDGGNYLFKEKDMQEFIKKEPASKKYFHPWYGADEFLNNRPRYCLYLGDCTPHELKSMPQCLKRVKAVKEFRLRSYSAPTHKLADTPTKFHVTNMPDKEYIFIPRVSSDERIYIPMGFLPPNVMASDAAHIMPNATIYHFGILMSRVHMAWMRVVCGRLGTDYRYSKDIVYNNFPWPEPDAKQLAKIENTAQKILDARNLYPDSSLADLYNDLLMPIELSKAHKLNDAAVCEAYGFDEDINESEIVAQLMRLYQELKDKERD